MSLTSKNLPLAPGVSASSLEELTVLSPDPSHIRTTGKEETVATKESCFLSSKEGTKDDDL